MNLTDLADLRRDYGPWTAELCPKCGSEQVIADDIGGVLLITDCPNCHVRYNCERDCAEDPRVLAMCDEIDSLNDLVNVLGRTLDRTADELRRTQRELDEERKTLPDAIVREVAHVPPD